MLIKMQNYTIIKLQVTREVFLVHICKEHTHGHVKGPTQQRKKELAHDSFDFQLALTKSLSLSDWFPGCMLSSKQDGVIRGRHYRPCPTDA